MIGGFPWELLSNAWVSAKPHYKTEMNLSKDTNYTVMKYGHRKGPDSALFFHNNLSYFNVFYIVNEFVVHSAQSI